MKRRTLFIGAAGLAVAFGLFLSPSAFAGPAGTDEGVDEDGAETNQVDCGEPGENDVDIADINVQVKTESNEAGDGGAIVACKDGDGPAAGTPADVQGRVIGAGGASEGGGYLAVDGDGDNDPNAQGWIRADAGGDGADVRCSAGSAEEGITNPDSTEPGEEDGIGSCPVAEDAGIAG